MKVKAGDVVTYLPHLGFLLGPIEIKYETDERTGAFVVKTSCQIERYETPETAKISTEILRALAAMLAVTRSAFAKVMLRPATDEEICAIFGFTLEGLSAEREAARE